MSVSTILATVAAFGLLALQVKRVVVHPAHGYRGARWLLGLTLLAGGVVLLVFVLREDYAWGLGLALLATLLAWAGTERLLPPMEKHEKQGRAGRRKAEKAAGSLAENALTLAFILIAIIGFCIEKF